jgi:hypothetical protein
VKITNRNNIDFQENSRKILRIGTITLTPWWDLNMSTYFYVLPTSFHVIKIVSTLRGNANIAVFWILMLCKNADGLENQ